MLMDSNFITFVYELVRCFVIIQQKLQLCKAFVFCWFYTYWFYNIRFIFFVAFDTIVVTKRMSYSTSRSERFSIRSDIVSCIVYHCIHIIKQML